MALKVYTGPDLFPVRLIEKDLNLGTWPDDDDWLGNLSSNDPAEDVMWGIDGKRRSTGGIPLEELGIYFAMLDSSNRQVPGTATVRGIVFNKPSGFGIPDQNVKYLRHPATDELAINLIDPFVMSVGRHPKMTVRITNISSGSGVRLYVAVQEIK